MKSKFIYLPLAALLYDSSAFCSAPLLDEDEDPDFKLALLLSKEDSEVGKSVIFDVEDEDFKKAIKLSQEERDRQFAITFSSSTDALPIEDAALEDSLVKEAIRLSLIPAVAITDENYVLENSFFEAVTQKSSQSKVSKEEEVLDGDIHLLGEIFKKLQVKYTFDLQKLKDSVFGAPNLGINQQDLANMSTDAIQELIDQHQQKQDTQLKQLAKDQGIIEPKDQKENMIVEFMKEKKCSRTFAEKAYKEFVGED